VALLKKRGGLLNNMVHGRKTERLRVQKYLYNYVRGGELRKHYSRPGAKKGYILGKGLSWKELE